MAQQSQPTLSVLTLNHIFGETLSESHFQQCLSQIQDITPKVGKFWQSSTSKAGIYIIIAGKVRLLDTDDELIATLGTGEFFGELTLFPEENFLPYDARASLNLKLYFLPSKVIFSLLNAYPSIRERLLQQAQIRNALLLKSEHLPSLESSQLEITNHWSVVAEEIQPGRKIQKAYFPTPTSRIGHWLQRIIRRYPFFAQQSASDCGAACLVMISRYWGKRFSVNRIRDIANVDRNGASLRGLVAAAESVGFSTRPVKASLDQLAKQPLPAIAHWEGKHYIVVYEITRKEVIIGDPAIGQLTLTYREFREKWTGYTLLLQPTAFLKNTQETVTPFWQFFELMKPYSLVLFEVFIASLLIQIFGLITPIFTQLILDRVVVQRSELTLFAVGLGLLIFGIFKVMIMGLRQYLLDHTSNKVDLALIVGFIRHTLRLPLSFFESRYVGDIISRVQENRKIQRFLSGEALSILLDLLTVFIYVGLMFWYSWKMALLVLVIVPPFFLLALIATPFLRRISREIFNSFANESSYLIEVLSGIRTVKSTAVEQTVRWHWEELLQQEITKSFSGQVISNRLQIFSNLIESLMTTALLWFGASLVIKDQLTIGQLVAFNMLLANVITPFQRLTILWNQVQEVVIAVERINDVLEAEPEEDLHHQVRQTLPPIKGDICFQQVTFRYHPESDINVLENLSFDIKSGQMIALVGRSGSGKTTISKLVLGLYPPTDGKVLIDGQDITTLSLRSLRHQIGVVDQDTFLFGGTIRENISLGHPGAKLEEVMEAARLAGADEFIKKLPMGYETQIGEGGGMLSGGQRQRLAIARALLGNPKLLVLDEATSHLDAESERIIQNNLNQILQGRTTLIIAHRLSTVRNADLILVLDKGILIEQGTHEELMAKRGHYYYLNHQQLNVA
ncbi:MAG: ATP-binding cassette domain-containing protein [Microcystis panniformis Mp_MB_F_20051200_S9]|uniref:ATP-binding cassette domain-containing protein n=1 Tax=Microcystis panniformis Mp_MB_F_20051200_S9 TaxID=2486223 RepID=A0A552Q331_9CHRO|nr:MAG: ATP-binding cassette domain-containing protein [Microcystis panniformis Mp_MB_F_20080800_S26D]TRV49923.1 MAG: ATP-binding cassette domain-containing protein [Microcystis panniformis Mp_GB_SS_20050300_S99D]TRV50473.1 MAG: ATP-binding cassette domain-containing protein [Microcystis panniformis Mp_GB_SS_20050300_S99]TRV63621.1 MAG: ATP-binding cassette domain-containing protein [Microcystis panniformis Mp_MB_F_20051200_S9]TRV65065.1 MAG: ATP-binding cassette domain-containing protein [Micr